MSLRLPLIEVLRHHLRANVLCYDYRGYGNSDQVQIDETGLMRDAHAAWRWLVGQSRVDATRIVLFGSSLGGAVTIQLARDLCKSNFQDATLPLPLGVVLMNTFTSIEAML
jgi:pimeloyl-ACP methyl ester carboxylesterase